ncbi:hypothetical protein BJ508DRAFT_160742 [Ascobolus immersus RN42]|uniref:Uncharacterized protein n=1 Tax=Ascobolus immersus RN42 TaxID=1160509 RepID=A0A3N4HW23_ASCIM|nr:hypothetical protein BJ508DRAFT_160742 [Ascobolus immersus RN42]
MEETTTDGDSPCNAIEWPWNMLDTKLHLRVAQCSEEEWAARVSKSQLEYYPEFCDQPRYYSDDWASSGNSTSPYWLPPAVISRPDGLLLVPDGSTPFPGNNDSPDESFRILESMEEYEAKHSLSALEEFDWSSVALDKAPAPTDIREAAYELLCFIPELFSLIANEIQRRHQTLISRTPKFKGFGLISARALRSKQMWSKSGRLAKMHESDYTDVYLCSLIMEFAKGLSRAPVDDGWYAVSLEREVGIARQPFVAPGQSDEYEAYCERQWRKRSARVLDSRTRMMRSRRVWLVYKAAVQLYLFMRDRVVPITLNMTPDTCGTSADPEKWAKMKLDFREVVAGFEDRFYMLLFIWELRAPSVESSLIQYCEDAPWEWRKRYQL